MAVRAQVVGRGEAGGTGADDPDAFAGVRRELGFRVAAVREAMFGRLGFQRTDEDGTVAAAAHARRFARRGTDEAARQRQRVVFADDLDGGAIVAVAEMRDEAGDVDVGRACAVTRRGLVFQAQSLGTGLTPGVLFPLLAVVTQRAPQWPGTPESLRGEFQGDLVECDEMIEITAPDGDLGDQSGSSREQSVHGCRLAFGELPVPVERAAGTLDDAYTFRDHHERRRHRDDARGRERQRFAREVSPREWQETTEPVVEDEYRVLALDLDAAAPVLDLASKLPGPSELDEAALDSCLV